MYAKKAAEWAPAAWSIATPGNGGNSTLKYANAPIEPKEAGEHPKIDRMRAELLKVTKPCTSTAGPPDNEITKERDALIQ
jgi:hypothetical protein